MLDVQSLPDDRKVPLEHVGVTRVPLPIRVKQKDGDEQHVQAQANLFVEVPAGVRGTHLSRLMESLTEWAQSPVCSTDLEALLQQTSRKCDSYSAEVDVTFRYDLPKKAPVSGKIGFLAYDCEFRGRLDDRGFSFVLGVKVPITTLCPCSKEISDYGAHNQRSIVAAQVNYDHRLAFLWLEDLIELIELQGSSPIYPILKRPDEKYVTEKAYDNPKFVEDVVRDVLVSLGSTGRVFDWASVECESQESIHGHNAYAAMKVGLPLPPSPSVSLPSGVPITSHVPARTMR